MKRFRTAAILVAILALLGGGLWWLERYTSRQIDGSVETIATASLQGLREQSRLVPFVARFVAVTTSQQSRLGLTAKQTMILPGVVRYELDLTQITARDIAWDEPTKTLTVYLPPMILTGPQVDLAGMQAYDGGGLLIALTDAEKTLDAANKQQGQKQLLEQARGATPMKLARDAARSAIERSFAMPLRAAGIEARVTAQFK